MKKKSISCAKWGYIFLIPFFVIYCIFSLIPLLQTFYYSVIDYTIDTGTISIFDTGSNVIDNGFCGIDNFKQVLSSEGQFLETLSNTAIMWIIGFIPQIVVSLLLAVWFTDLRLKIKAQGFFKTVIYLPNIIMASAVAMLFYSLFTGSNGEGGTLYMIFNKFTPDDISLLSKPWGARGIVGFINFMMWYGNTTILLMAAIMGVDTSLYESAQIDGANPTQTFWKITIPLIKPILSYVLITSMIGGIQMYDIPSLMCSDSGMPMGKTKTIVMLIQTGRDSTIGNVAAVSVLIFIVTAFLGFLTFKFMNGDAVPKKKKKSAKAAK